MISGRNKQIVSVLISNVFARGFGLLFFVIAARLLYPAEFGNLRTMVAFASVFGIAAFSGFPQSLARYIASGSSGSPEKLKSEMPVIYSASMVGTVAVLAITFAILLMISELTIAIIVLILGETIYYYYLGLVRGRMSFWKFSIANFSTGGCKVLFLIPFFIFTIPIDSTSLAIAFGLSYIVPLLIMELVSPSRFPLHGGADLKKMLRSMLYFSIPIILANLAYTLLFSGDILVVEWSAGAEQAGFYGVSKTIVQVFLFLPIAINAVLLPSVAKSCPRNLGEAFKVLKKPLLATLIISLAGFLLLWVLEGQIIWIFGDDYDAASASLVPMSFAMVLYSLYVIIESFFIGIGKPRVHMYSVGSGTIVFFIFAFLVFHSPGQAEVSYSLIAGCASILIMATIFLMFVMKPQRIEYGKPIEDKPIEYE